MNMYSAGTQRSGWAKLAWLLCVALLVGCGSGEEVYQLSGKITFKGKPVPSGFVIFEPDGAQGNQGAPGRAEIIDGQYDTRGERGHGIVGGPHRVRIVGMDGGSHGQTAGEIGLPNPLFAEYTVTEDLPKQDGEKDFEVPAQR